MAHNLFVISLKDLLVGSFLIMLMIQPPTVIFGAVQIRVITCVVHSAYKLIFSQIQTAFLPMIFQALSKKLEHHQQRVPPSVKFLPS